MRRRDFVKIIAGLATVRSNAVNARQPGRRVIGVLIGIAQTDAAAQSWLAAFRDALGKLGWKDGSNLQIEIRWGAGDADRIGTLAKELVDMRPDAIFSVTTPALDALARETRAIPIVFALVADPISGGFAASIAHPGGNITGFTTLDPGLGGKWVSLSKEIAPRTVRMALLFNPATSSPLQFYLPAIQAAASPLGVDISAAPVRATEELEGVILGQARNSGSGLILIPDIFNVKNGDLIISLASRYRISGNLF